MSLKKWLLPILIVGAIFSAVLPYETVVVPAWTLRIVDENGHPYSEKQVRQTWKHYTLELDPSDNIEHRWTNADGFVSFPERTIRANLITRCLNTVVNMTARLAHGSTGISASVAATGPKGYQRLEYDSDSPFQKLLILPSKP